MTLLAKKKMEQKFECKFCGTKFHREGTLFTHMCVKKQRTLDINTAGFKFGFRTFQRYYSLVMKAKKPKTHDDFIDSQFYINFVKFGNHIDMLRPVHIDHYIDFVILSGLKIDKWTTDPVYDLYIENLIKTEPAQSAVERTISYLIDWCEKNEVKFVDSFDGMSANEAAHLIKTGRISPWVLYLSSSGGDLMNRFSDDHAKMVASIIDPGFWMRKFKKADDDVTDMKSMLQLAGI